MPSPTPTTVSQLSHLIGTPGAPCIVDVCTDEDFALNPRLIPTAIRHPYNDIQALVTQLASRHVVIVCHKGLKLSQGAAAILRANGINAESLLGGNVAWQANGEISIPVSKLPEFNRDKPTLWVTQHQPKIDQMACSWLIRRFIDPCAQFLFVSTSEVLTVAERFKAIPFGINGVFWGSREQQCTFDTMIEGLELKTSALKQLALMIRGADTNQLNLTAQSAGLLAFSLGLSRMYLDDLKQLEIGLIFYDSLYRWVRDE